MGRGASQRWTALISLALIGCGMPRGHEVDAATDDVLMAADVGPVDAGFVPASHPPFPVLPRNGDAELVPLRLVVIVGPSEPSAAQLFAFGDALVTSSWLTTVGSDYGVGVADTPAVHLTGGALPASLGFGALADYVTATIASHPEAAPNGRTVYLVFYPPGTTYPDSCSTYGAHDTLLDYPPPGMPTDAIAYVQRCPHAPGLSDMDYLTSVASHEVIEAASDSNYRAGYAMPVQLTMLMGTSPPWSISSWSYFQQNEVENADLCEGTLVHEGAFAYQRVWSITAAAAGGDPCVPALSLPYFSVATPTDWIEVPAGTTAVVPVTGWSTAPRPDWWVTVRYTSWSPYGFDPAFAGVPTAPMQNGRTAMLSITTPSTPGEFAVFRLDSSPDGPALTGGGGTDFPQPPTGDAYHGWAFGIHTTSACTSGCPAAPASCGNATCEASGGENCGNCPDDCGVCGAVCGAANFSVTCAAGSCPTHGHCGSGGICQCDTGFVEMPCHGDVCPTGGCAFPDYWCVPATCGAANFDMTCPGGTCPSAATCAPMNRCDCPPGTQVSTCTGQPCPTGGCAYPNWWCTSCGATNFIVTCSDGSTCPAFSACNADGTCSCLAGYHDVACDGTSCSAGCAYPDWWCAENL